MSSDEFESYTPVRRKKKPRTSLKRENVLKNQSELACEAQTDPGNRNDAYRHPKFSKVNEWMKDLDACLNKDKDNAIQSPRRVGDVCQDLSNDVPLIDLEDEEENKLFLNISTEEYFLKKRNDEGFLSDSSPRKGNNLAAPLSSPKNLTPKKKWEGIQQKNLITNYFIAPVKSKAKGLITDHFNYLKITNIRTCEKQQKLETQVVDNQQEIQTTSQNDVNSNKPTRACPFYKLVENFAVDAFSYGLIPNVKVYFLSHFHYDHYRGLGKKFSGQIYCSSITANLVSTKLKLPSTNLVSVPIGEPFALANYCVTFLDANHCPGSVVIFFQGKHNILHTGDFRAENFLQRYPFLLEKKIDVLYLDTTYLDPSYCFPSQSTVLEHVRDIVIDAMTAYGNILIACGTYTIGKEKVFLTAAETLGSKIWAPKWKVQILRCLEDQFMESLITEDPSLARVHVLPMKQLALTELTKYVAGLKFRVNHVVALKPSGWEFNNENLSQIQPCHVRNISFYGIPYSEHSSFTELKDFVTQLKPRKVIPTVNVGNRHSREKMMRYIDTWI